MEHQRWIKRTLISAAVATSFGLTACGGGGGDSAGLGDITPDATTTTLSGIVADGYLVNATVCLDINHSKTCDSGEPTAISTSGGKYSLKATQAQVNTYPVVAEIIAGITFDEDHQGEPVQKAYTLTAPVGKGAFVSPLTTMVHAQMETTGKTAEQIEIEILARIGQDPAVISLFDDYVAQETDSTNPVSVQDGYLRLHQVAQVTAAAIASSIETIEAAVSSGDINLDLSAVFDSLITIMAQNIVAELTAIAGEVDAATAFDADTIAAAVVPPLDTTVIKEQVAVVEAAANSEGVSDVEAVFTNGLSWLWAEFLPWSNEMARSTITYNASTGTLSEPIETFNAAATPYWSQASSTADSLVLQANGSWLAVTDSWDGVSVTFDNSAGTATIDSNHGMEALSNIRVIDLTGLSIKAFVENNLPEVSPFVLGASPRLSEFIDPESVFTAGSSAYSLYSTTLEDSYTIPISDSCPSCNTVAATSLAEIPSPAIAWTDPGTFGDLPATYGVSAVANLYFEVVQGDTGTSGPVNYYHNPPVTLEVTKVGTGSWTMTTVKGVEMLMIDHPDALMSQFSTVATDMESPEENHFFVGQGPDIRKGKHMPANIVETTADSLLTNPQAQAEIIGAFITWRIANTVPSVELTCDTDSGWNPLIGQPLVFYSFTDYQAVVAACGGAQPVDTNALIYTSDDFLRNHQLSDGGYIQFFPDNTGTYQRGGLNINFNWTINPATNYITVENSPVTFRNILAVVGVDSTVDPAAFNFKGYIEQAGSSDMITGQGSDGEI